MSGLPARLGGLINMRGWGGAMNRFLPNRIGSGQLLATLLIVMLPLFTDAAPMVVRYYYTPADAVRYAYYYELLEQAMQRTEAAYGPFRLVRESMPMSSSRMNAEAVLGKRINVLWSDVGHKELDEDMIPIPVPADRGVHGYRVFLIRSDRQPDFDKVRTLADLRRLVVGQGANWGDIKIFQHNRLRVMTAPTYDLLFHMLELGRFDYFSRSVLEALAEIEAFGPAYPDLVIERRLLLHYPFPVLFYVTKREPELARRLKAGLEALVEDGSLQKLFDRHFGAALAQLNFRSRRVIELENPFLPKFVPLSRSKLWFNPLEIGGKH